MSTTYDIGILSPIFQAVSRPENTAFRFDGLVCQTKTKPASPSQDVERQKIKSPARLRFPLGPKYVDPVLLMARFTTSPRIRDWLRVELHCGIALLPQNVIQLRQSEYPSFSSCQIWFIPLVRTIEFRNLVTVQIILLAIPP